MTTQNTMSDTQFHAPVAHRVLWLGAFLSVAGLLSYGYYLQFVEYLIPCPLCITQRLFYYSIGVAAIIGLLTLRKRGGQKLAAAVMFFSAIGGIVTAGRQVWLQHLPPDQVPECGPGLEYWLDNMPFLSTLELLFKGDGNCAEVHWRFLGFSIGEWSLAWFIGFLCLGIYLFFARRSAA